MKLEPVKVKVFIDKPQFESNKKYALDGRIIRCFFRKSRGTNVQGILKCTKGTKVILEEEDLPKLREIASQFRQTISRRTEYIYLDEILVGLFTSPDKHIVIATKDLHSSFMTMFNHTKYYNLESDSLGYGSEIEDSSYDKSTFEFIIYDLEDFIECKKTSVELAKIKTEEDRKATEKINTVCLKDTITAVLSEAGINIELIEGNNYLYNRFDKRAYIKPASRSDWNKLVVTAINNYINGIAKEAGFTVDAPIIKKNVKITEDTPLFFMDGVKILDEGEQNG